MRTIKVDKQQSIKLQELQQAYCDIAYEKYVAIKQDNGKIKQDNGSFVSHTYHLSDEQERKKRPIH